MNAHEREQTAHLFASGFTFLGITRVYLLREGNERCNNECTFYDTMMRNSVDLEDLLCSSRSFFLKHFKYERDPTV